MAEKQRVAFADGRIEERFVRPSFRGQRQFRSGYYAVDGDLGKASPDAQLYYVLLRRLRATDRAADWKEIRRSRAYGVLAFLEGEHEARS